MSISGNARGQKSAMRAAVGRWNARGVGRWPVNWVGPPRTGGQAKVFFFFSDSAAVATMGLVVDCCGVDLVSQVVIVEGQSELLWRNAA